MKISMPITKNNEISMPITGCFLIIGIEILPITNRCYHDHLLAWRAGSAGMAGIESFNANY